MLLLPTPDTPTEDETWNDQKENGYVIVNEAS